MQYSVNCAVILLLVIKLVNSDVETRGPKLKIPFGEILGKYLKSRDGITFSAFLGIPYAEKPARFQSPKPVKSWEGVKNATTFGNKCLQGSRGGFPHQHTGSEDCLFLNVYTPDVKGNFPLMVYIHGGAFMFRSAEEYSGKYYMDEEVVLVTMNYRLGALGFLSTGDDVIPGNYGLKDQNLALRWVQENIMSFGGDKDRVTIFGASAGGSSVSYHILSSKGKGLFHRAISQSGSALNPWAFVINPKQVASEFAKKIGCTDDSQKLANCLKGKTVNEIIEAQNSMTKWYMDPLALFAPTKEMPSVDAFLVEFPLKILEDGSFNKVPWLVTATKDEGQVLHAAAIIHKIHLLNELNEEWERIAPITFEYDDIGLSEENKSSISEEISKFYFDGKKIEKASQQELSNLYSDRWFVHGIQKAVLFHANYTPVYAGIFAFRGSPSQLPFVGVPANHDIVTHGDDVKFHFPYNVKPVENQTHTQEEKEAQEKTSKMLVKLWVQFASGSPSELKVNNVTWPKVSSEEIETGSLKWLLLDNQPEILNGIFEQRIKFWDDVLNKFTTLNRSSTTNDEL